ncbi:hypothetical protein A3A75_04830 [Candidatus Woesebacteria bacterium RIFCSPLOWO2_01_FULL_39_10]|uniref:Cell division protein FtsL n=1 Tax=Candidatus Woesebacteria bacterium RIFCSPLOWO2_01_FULL_39_10 TaxID=1802516 RepID=A0A1F8B4H3_9BACT|nr:MAG: hypothetical protein A3A75_04830 [Candidatus Woesebacteria bacterium RIFCSPLOWO2_01_FULL_39_10]
MKYARKVTQTKKRFRLSKKTLLWAIVGLFIAVQVFFTIQTAATGAKIANFERKVTELVNTNKNLESKLVEATSLSKLEEKAFDLGFVKNTETVYLKAGVTFAKLP